MGMVKMFNFFLPEFRQDPYPFYQRLRESDPIHWGISFEPGIGGMWHIARYSDILQILRDQRFTHQAPPDNSAGDTSPDFIDPLQLYFSLSRQSLLFADPPAHTRLRALVSRAFTPRMIEGLRPRVEATASALLQAGQKRGNLDVVNEYALPLTITIIAEMLGVPPEGRAQLTSWAGVLIRAVDCKQSPDIYASAAQVAHVVQVDHLFPPTRRNSRTDEESDFDMFIVQQLYITELELSRDRRFLSCSGRGFVSWNQNPLKNDVSTCSRLLRRSKYSKAYLVPVLSSDVGDVCALLLNWDPQLHQTPRYVKQFGSRCRHCSH